MANKTIQVPAMSVGEAVSVFEAVADKTLVASDSDFCERVLAATLKISELMITIEGAAKTLPLLTQVILAQQSLSMVDGDTITVQSPKGSIVYTQQTTVKVDYDMEQVNQASGVKVTRTFEHPEFADCYGKETEGKRINKKIQAHIDNGTLPTSVCTETSSTEMVASEFISSVHND